MDSAAVTTAQQFAVAAVATSPLSYPFKGVSVSPDGYTPSPGDLILVAGQPTFSENGPWVADSSWWRRPNEFTTGSLTNGATALVIAGTLYAGTTWSMTSLAGVRVDVSSQIWALQVPTAGGAPLIPSLWYPADQSGAGPETLALNSLYATPVVFPVPHAFQALGVLVGAYTGSTGVIRLGYYLDNGSGAPGPLVADLGTVATPNGGGPVTKPAAIPLKANVPYWLVMDPQVDATGLTVYCNFGRTSSLLGQNTPVGLVESWVGSGVAGALPATFPGSPVLALNPPIVQLEA